MNRTMAAMTALALVSGCSKPRPEQAKAGPTSARQNPVPAPAPRLKPAIDPKSSEAAQLLVGSFVKLLNEGRIGDAYMLLGPGAGPRAQFESGFRDYDNLKVKMGAASDQEGAAGSIYLSVPLGVSGHVNGEDVDRRASVIVRRVNDVPSSTEAQRRWHIERIDWK